VNTSGTDVRDGRVEVEVVAKSWVDGCRRSDGALRYGLLVESVALKAVFVDSSGVLGESVGTRRDNTSARRWTNNWR
jgi:hypothetical protein